IAVITISDIRWQRCDIKSVALLPNVLGKQRAKEVGAYEAWQIDREGHVTEGTSTNAWIVTVGHTVVTRQADKAILNGITRLAVGYHPPRRLRLCRASVHGGGGESSKRGLPDEHHGGSPARR